MEGVINNSVTNKTRLIIYDLVALVIIYLTPTFSHIFDIPVYYLDPMRFALFLVVIQTNKKNSYVIAATLPLVSFIASSHPVFLKSLTMSVELLLNVWLYYELSKMFKNKFAPATISIIASKMVYYAIKYLLMSFALISTDLISTPLQFQIAVLLIISAYAFIVIPRDKQLKK